jgi:hypothetical protein
MRRYPGKTESPQTGAPVRNLTPPFCNATPPFLTLTGLRLPPFEIWGPFGILLDFWVCIRGGPLTPPFWKFLRFWALEISEILGWCWGEAGEKKTPPPPPPVGPYGMHRTRFGGISISIFKSRFQALPGLAGRLSRPLRSLPAGNLSIAPQRPQSVLWSMWIGVGRGWLLGDSALCL